MLLIKDVRNSIFIGNYKNPSKYNKKTFFKHKYSKTDFLKVMDTICNIIYNISNAATIFPKNRYFPEKLQNSRKINGLERTNPVLSERCYAS